jgi:hypothetical protein
MARRESANLYGFHIPAFGPAFSFVRKVFCLIGTRAVNTDAG